MPRLRRIHYAWVIVFLGFLSVLGAHGFGRFAYPLILRDMKTSLDLTYTQMGLIATANFVGYLTLATLGGALASKHGSRLVIALSALLMGFSMICIGLSNNFLQVLAFSLITGLGNGGVYLPAVALPSIWFAMKYRGRATGYVTAGIGAGFAVGGIVVPLILRTYLAAGWRYAWYYLGAALLAIGLIDYVLLRNRPEDVGLKPLGAEEAATSSNPSTSSALQWSLVYRSKEIWLVGLVYFMYGFSYIIYITYFAAYLEEAFAWSKELIGLLWFILGMLSISSGATWGYVSDVMGRKYGIALAYLTLSLSYLLYALALPPYGLYASAVIFGLAAWSIPTLAVVAAADYVSPELRSAAAGFVTLFFGIGQAIGPTVGGLIKDLTGFFANAFYLASLVAFIGAVGALFLRRPPAQR